MFKLHKFNHMLTATFLVYTSLLCALYAYLLFHAVHEIENQAAQIYLQNAHVEVLRELTLIEQSSTSPTTLAGHTAAMPPLSDAQLIAALIEHLKHSRPQLNIYTSLAVDIPAYLKSLPSGLHEYQTENAQILVSSLPGKNFTLYLVYDETNVSNLDEKTPEIIVALSSIALFICLLGFMVSILLGRKIAKPLKQLAQEVGKSEPTLPLVGHQRTDEIGTLSRNFTVSIERYKQFLTREKLFSRHVSHELRTPVAIISNCMSLLKLENVSDEAKNTALNRIDRATSSMSKLIETFLLLGREQENSSKVLINLRDLVFSELEKINLSSKARALKPKILICHDGIVRSETALLGILINNLLRNALAYSASVVRITLSHKQLIIDNDIAALDSISSSGFGYGTEIIARITQSLCCRVTVEKTDVRYRVSVRFSD